MNFTLLEGKKNKLFNFCLVTHLKGQCSNVGVSQKNIFLWQQRFDTNDCLQEGNYLDQIDCQFT